MKFFIAALVFALAVCNFASAQGFDGGWVITPYDPKNDTLVTLYNFGFETAEIHAISGGFDPNADWVANQVNSLEILVQTGFSYYKFNVEITRGTNDTVPLEFVVSNPPLNFVSWQFY